MSQEIPLKAAIKNSFWLCAVNRNFIWSTELLQQICCWESGSSSLMGQPSLQLKLLQGKALGSWNAALAHSFRLIVVTTEESLDASPLAGIEVSVTFHWEIWEIWDWQKHSSLFLQVVVDLEEWNQLNWFLWRASAYCLQQLYKYRGNPWPTGLARLRRKQMCMSPPLGQKKHPPAREYWQGKKEGTENYFLTEFLRKWQPFSKYFRLLFFFETRKVEILVEIWKTEGLLFL